VHKVLCVQIALFNENMNLIERKKKKNITYVVIELLAFKLVPDSMGYQHETATNQARFV
jgi:hypothetical protein